MIIALAVAALLVAAATATAETILPPGFTTEIYVSGRGFQPEHGPGTPGIPSSSTLAVDGTGVLYIGRTGRRYSGGEADDLWPIFRIPVGGARLTPETERRFLYGPPLFNAQVAGISPAGELFVTTYDRDRKIGVLYRLVDGRAELVAGGTPERGVAPLLRQPEGVAFDHAGHIYVADRAQDVVVKLDAAGRVVDARFLSFTRPRLLTVDARGRFWVGSDEQATAPWQRSPGVLWLADGERAPAAMLRGPLAAGLAVAPDGRIFLADRHGARILALDGDGVASEFARFTDGDAPRGLTFVPDTPATRQAGLSGDLLVITISRGRWPANEVIRVSGPFGAKARRSANR
jgi:hypothetical protein